MMFALPKFACRTAGLGTWPLSVKWGGKQYRSAEALFQATRFENEEFLEAIRGARSPFAAKLIAKGRKDWMVIEPQSRQDLENIKICLRLKLEATPWLRQLLKETGDAQIIEDCSRRGTRGSYLFWGAVCEGETWEGQNWLGRLWMKLRKEMLVAG